jgi:hypothetical protein
MRRTDQGFYWTLQVVVSRVLRMMIVGVDVVGGAGNNILKPLMDRQ